MIAFFLGVRLDVQDDIGAHRVTGGLLDGETVYAVGIPLISLVAAVGTGDDGDVIGHHEGGVEAHAELTDHVHIGLVYAGAFGHVLAELEGAGTGDGA